MSKALIYFSVFSAIIPIIIGIMALKKTSLAIYWVILILSIVSFTSDSVGLIYFLIVSRSTFWVINIYQITEIILIGYFLYLYLEAKKVVLVITLLFLLYFLYHIFIINFNEFYGTTLAVHALVNILFCLLVFYQFYKSEQEIFIEQSPIFWMNIGLLTYFSGALFSFLLSIDILQIGSGYNWHFHNIANILKNILFAIGLWKVRAVA